MVASPENQHFASLFLLNSLDMENILPTEFKMFAEFAKLLYSDDSLRMFWVNIFFCQFSRGAHENRRPIKGEGVPT